VTELRPYTRREDVDYFGERKARGGDSLRLRCPSGKELWTRVVRVDYKNSGKTIAIAAYQGKSVPVKDLADQGLIIDAI